MKFSLKQDTLAFQLSRPALMHRDMSLAMTPAVGAQCKTFRTTDPATYLGIQKSLGKSMGSPERDALAFYVLNHAVAIVRQRTGPFEPLGESLEILNRYHEVLAVRTLRMFFYMLLICTRESRHRKDSDSGSLMIDLASKYGMQCVKFNNSIKGTGSDSAANAFCNSPPSVTLGKYTSFLVDLFNKGSYSSGYGGKAWGKVAEVLCNYVHGKISAEMMMDVSFALCHNGGPIFNKGMLFSGYGSDIYKILDVQRAGMIPQLIGNAEIAGQTDPEISDLYTLCHSVLGSVFEGYVDWFAVEKLGAQKTYPQEKALQVKKYGTPSTSPASVTIDGIKEKIKSGKESVEASKFIHLHPGCAVKMVERD